MTNRQQAYAIRREQIIDAALQVFAEKGYKAATNKDIAQAAGIKSPGLIYHYFEDKKRLFQAVLQERMPVVQTAVSSQGLREQPVPKVLQQIGEALLETSSSPQTISLLRLLLGEALRQPDVLEITYQAGSSQILQFLYDYFAQLMSQGRIRKMDLGVVLRCFLGPFIAYIFSADLLVLPDEHTPDKAVMVDTAVSVFLSGVGYQPE